MTKALSIENGSKRITINNINLGYFDIGMIDKVPISHQSSILATIPVGQLGQPTNIIKTVKFIIENEDLCGASLDVNGGLI